MRGNKYLNLAKSLIVAAAIIVSAASVMYSSRLRGRAAAQSNAAAPAETDGASEIRGYREWTLVNTEPAVMDMSTAILCAPADVRGRDIAGQQANPHKDKFIKVFVNDVGRGAMLTERVPQFPRGSVVVKEKLPNRISTSPELLTVMIKRETGFNPESGDWEYLVFDGAGTKIAERGRLQSCQSCHLSYKDTDFVTRLYLPDRVRRGLK
jgi:hypothetical protein